MNHNPLFRKLRTTGMILTWMLMLFSGSHSYAQTYVFAKLDGVPLNTTGWNLQGAAYLGNTGSNTGNGELILTDPVGTSSGAIFYNTPIDLTKCVKWTAEFEFRIADGNAADGISFCYLDVPPSGFVSGGGLGIPATANGLKVCIDTWRNCGNDAVPKLELRWGNGYDECAAQPTINNNNGTLNFIRSGEYHKAKITYDNGSINFSINGVVTVTGNQTFNFAGYFGFTASTGGFWDRHSIRNVRIYTEMPPSEAGVNHSFCSGGSAVLGTTGDPNYQYQWTPATGLSSATAANPTVTLTHNQANPLQRWYYVETAFTGRTGCSSRDSVLVEVAAHPQLAIVDADKCLGDSSAFTATVFNVASEPAGYQWLWTFNDPAATAANPNTASTFSARHFYAQAGSYRVDLQAVSPQGCTGNTSITHAVNKIPAAGFSILNDGKSCVYEFVEIRQGVSTADITRMEIFPDGLNSPPVVISQNLPAPGTVIRLTYPGWSDDPPNKTADIHWVNYGQGGCKASDMQTVTFLDQPMAQFDPLPVVCISKAPFSLTSAATETSGLSGTKTFSGKGVSNNGLFDPAAAGAGNHALQYIFTADNGCKDTAAQQQEVWPLPVVDAGTDRYILPGGTTTLMGTASVQPLQVQWTPASDLTDPQSLNTEASPLRDTRYMLAVDAGNDCVGTDSVWVKVLPDLKVPNAFSPNNDGINDFWEIPALASYPGCVVTLFDRYGRQILQQQGYGKPWDGYSKSGPVPVGVYYYIIDPKNGARIIQGSVTLVR